MQFSLANFSARVRSMGLWEKMPDQYLTISVSLPWGSLAMEPSGRTMPTLMARRPNGFHKDRRRVTWACLPPLGFRLFFWLPPFVLVEFDEVLVWGSLVSLRWLSGLAVLLGL